MKLYHLSVANDKAGESLVAEHLPVLQGVVAPANLSRSFGIGPSIVVIILPDNVSPADVGLPDATWVQDIATCKERPMSNPSKALGTGLENRVVARAKAAGLHRPQTTALRNPQGLSQRRACVGGFHSWASARSGHAPELHRDAGVAGERPDQRQARCNEGAFLVYNPKGSRTPRVLLDLDLFFLILKSTYADA